MNENKDSILELINRILKSNDFIYDEYGTKTDSEKIIISGRFNSYLANKSEILTDNFTNKINIVGNKILYNSLIRFKFPDGPPPIDILFNVERINTNFKKRHWLIFKKNYINVNLNIKYNVTMGSLLEVISIDEGNELISTIKKCVEDKIKEIDTNILIKRLKSFETPEYGSTE